MAENPANLHVVGRTADGQLWHTIRSPSGWTPFGDVLAAANLPSFRGRVVDVACARRAAIAAPGNIEGLYVLVAFEDEPPRLLFRSSNGGSWSQQPGVFFPTARKVAAGTFTSVPQSSGTGLNQIHMAAVTDDGTYSLRSPMPPRRSPCNSPTTSKRRRAKPENSARWRWTRSPPSMVSPLCRCWPLPPTRGYSGPGAMEPLLEIPPDNGRPGLRSSPAP